MGLGEACSEDLDVTELTPDQI